MKKSTENDCDIDIILVQLGEFGRYQIQNFILICIGVIVLSEMSLTYVFTSGILQYRCNVPGCDQEPYQFNQQWTSNAIPQRNGLLDKCLRFEQVTTPSDPSECNNSLIFDNTRETTCNDFIYETNELTLQNEFNLTCDENEWKLTLIGTINNVGLFFFMAIMGILSDKFGRRTTFIYSLFVGAIAGTIKSFSVNYIMFAICEFIDSSIVAGTYAIAFVLAMEMLGPKKRVFGGTLIACSYTVGEVLLGLTAMFTLNFRLLIRVVYCPMLLVLVYFWFIPESVRWLWVKGRNLEAVNVVKKAAKINRVKLNDETLESLYGRKNDQSNASLNVSIDSCNKSTEQTGLSTEKSFGIKTVFKSRILLLRLLKCFLVWMTCAFVYYGLSLSAVTLAGNKFLNFMLVCSAEIPGYIVTNLITGRLGRKWSLCLSLMVCGVACIGSIYIPPDQSFVRLGLFLLGKAAITVSFTTLYVYTSEMFPTSLRNSLVLICSTVGRIGSMTAPQTPLLAKYVPSLPLFLFGGLAIASALTVLLFPETLNASLPDTIEEAENIGKSKK